MSFAVCVTFRIHPSHRAAFETLMIENATCSLRVEPGCLQFDVAFDPSRPDEVFLYERYADAPAFQAHLDSAHFRRFDQAVAGMVAAKEVKTYSRVIT